MIEPLPDPRERAAAPSGAPGFALWSLGFRPFYLLASVVRRAGALTRAGTGAHGEGASYCEGRRRCIIYGIK